MAITLNGTNGFTTDNAALKLDGTTLVVDDTNNRVGVGTDSPVQKQHLDGGAGDTYLQFSNSTTGATSSDGSRIGLASADNSLRIQNLESGSIRFDTNTVERARITSSGNWLVNRTASSSSVVVHELNFAASSQIGIRYHMTDTTYNNAAIEFIRSDGTRVGYIYANGSSTAYVTSSDYRLKEDWQPMTGASERVKALKPVNFAWKVDGSRVDGFLAHEAKAVVPEAVTGEKDAVELVDIKDEDGNVTGQEERPVYQGIDQSKLVPLLTAALQEALTKIDSLTARIEALEATNV